jgi:peptidoglycan hydrolase CwlO-like protein
MSTAQIGGFKKVLLETREKISQLPSQSAFTGNAMSHINATLDCLNNEVTRLEAEAKATAEREAANLEAARKVVAEADAKAAEAIAKKAADTKVNPAPPIVADKVSDKGTGTAKA